MYCKNNSYYIWFIFITLLLGFVIGCAPNRSYGVKSFFLDGVPSPYQEDQDLVLDTLLVVQQDSVEIPIKVVREPIFNLHLPYQEKKCDNCHDPNYMGDLKTPKEKLCFTCHDNYNNTFTNVHGPVASGNCTQCHNPHQSKLKYLLVAESQALCFECHIQQKVENYKIHATIEDTSCTVCHNPHGGQNKHLLQKNACYECHDNYEEKYTNLHGPVAAGGLCNTCHEDHDSKKPLFLKQTGSELCLSCHNSPDIYNAESHQEANKQNCTTCHNPHGSQQNYLLTPIKE